FLAIVVGISGFDLTADLVDTTRNLLGVASTFNDDGLLLADNDLACGSQHIYGGVFQVQTDFFRNDLTTCQNGDVIEHCLATVAKAWGFNSHGFESSANLVDNQSCQGFAFQVFGNNQQWFAALHDFFQDTNHVTCVGNLGIHKLNVWIFKNGFLAFTIGGEVTGNVTFIEAHTFGQFQFQAKGVGFFNSYNTFFTDFVERFSNETTNFVIAG